MKNNDTKRLLHELRNVMGAKNITGVWWSSYKKKWMLTFEKGENMTFETMEEIIDWVKSEMLQE